MRINRLDLTRYGMFTDYVIDFGARATDACDLHIIYGLNEAGKSTALAAFLDLVFGIEPRSRYGFLHSYPTMRIGGEIEISGNTRQFVRIKRAENSLLDGTNNPISDGIILGDLGGIDRASYSTMFSLDDETLERGGESILASRGDLGQLLFSASSGLSDLSQKLIQLRAEADKFYKYRARGNELSELKDRLAELKKQREAIDTAASEYAKLSEARDRAAAQYDNAMVERGRIQSKMEILRREVAALPRLAALRRIREQIEPLADIPDAPAVWGEELPKLLREEITLSTRATGVESEMRNISNEIDSLVADDRVLGLAERIDLLADLRARFATADMDIPERRLQQRETDAAISGVLKRLECDPKTDPGSLLLATSTTGALRELMERRSGIETGLETTEAELAEARRRFAGAQIKLKEAGGEARSEAFSRVSQLAAVVSAARADDYAARRRLAERARREKLQTMTEQVSALRPWTGETEELLQLSVPDANDIERWKSSIADAEKRVERCDADLERLSADQRRLTAEIEAARNVVGVLSDLQAADIRTAREQAWSSHKRTLDAETADTFEACLRGDDIVTNSRIGNAAQVARLNHAGETLATVTADLAAVRDSRLAATEVREGIQAQIRSATRMMAALLPHDWSISKLESWLATRREALETLAATERAERDAHEAERDGEEVRRKLIEAANTAGIEFASDASAESLLTLIQTAINRESELSTLRSQVTECRRDVEDRERKTQAARAAEQAWNDSWIKICTGCWLGQSRSIPTVATIREVLKALEELVPLIERKDSLADRIRKMEDDQFQFVTDIESLATALEIENVTPPLETSAQIVGVLEKTRGIATAREAASLRLNDAQARKKAILDEKEIHDRRKVGMTAHFKVESLEEVDGKVRSLEKRQDCQEQAAAAELEILAALGVPSLEIAMQNLDVMDRGAVDAEIAELKGRFEDQDNRARELFNEQSKASDRLEAVGGDDAVAKIDERRGTILLEITEGAKHYLRIRFGVAAAEHSLRIFRDQHRSSMMTRASEAFRIISRRAYKSLTTQPDADTEVLVAVGTSDGSKIASELSKGTRFQLYLALRVAGYVEFAQLRQPVPFIADDIMETFDDFRAEEAFKLFAEMARVGQVIYLTHHRHLCEIVRTVCPAAQVHELSAR